MKFPKGKVVYDEVEMKTYLPLWRIISEDEDLKSKREQLSRQVFWASDPGLCDGTDPLVAELIPFKDAVQQAARRLHPGLTEDQFRNFMFYVLHHDGESAECDLDTPPTESPRK